jgi:hypothetical protein
VEPVYAETRRAAVQELTSSMMGTLFLASSSKEIGSPFSSDCRIGDAKIQLSSYCYENTEPIP